MDPHGPSWTLVDLPCTLRGPSWTLVDLPWTLRGPSWTLVDLPWTTDLTVFFIFNTLPELYEATGQGPYMDPAH